MSPTAKTIVADLRAWCAVERGRPARVAQIVGVNPSTVSRWITDTRSPNLDEGLKIMAFLRRERLKEKRRA